MHHGMDAVILRWLCGDECQIRHLHWGHDGVFAILAFINDRTVTADLIDIPTQFAHPGRDCFTAVVGTAGDAHKVTHFYRSGGRLRGLCGFYLAAQLCRDLFSKIVHTSIHPVAGAGFVGEPSVDSQYHLIRLRGVAQRFRLIFQPEQLGFAVALTDIHAELDERLVNDVLDRIRFGGIGSALNGDGSLVVCVGGRTPRTIFLLHIHTDPSVCADAVVAAGLTGCRIKNITQRFHTALTHHAVWRDTVNAVGALPRMVGRKFGVGHQGTVRVSHIIRPPFRHGHEAAPARISASVEWAVPDKRHSQAGTHPCSTGRRK